MIVPHVMTRALRLASLLRIRSRTLRRSCLLFGSAGASLALLAAGCGSLATGDTTTVVRLVDAVPTTNPVDFWIAGTDFINGVVFTGVTTYGYISTGSNAFVGFDTGTSTVVVPSQSFNIAKAVYTVAAAGIVGSATTPPTFFLFTDDNTPPRAGNVRVRVINLSPDAGTVNVTMGGTTVASSLAYGAASPYATLPGGTYNITALSSASSTSVAVKSSVLVTAGHVFTIFVEGQVGANNATIVPQADI